MSAKSCYGCKFYSGEKFLACAVDPVTAATSPEEGCKDWEPAQFTFWDVALVIALLAGLITGSTGTGIAFNDYNPDPYELSAPASVRHFRED